MGRRGPQGRLTPPWSAATGDTGDKTTVHIRVGYARHPDKIADQISDAILDALLRLDPRSRVAVETLITTGQLHVAGEVNTQAYADIPGIVRETILNIGYVWSAKGFDGRSCGVNVSLGAQSPDIAGGLTGRSKVVPETCSTFKRRVTRA